MGEHLGQLFGQKRLGDLLSPGQIDLQYASRAKLYLAGLGVSLALVLELEHSDPIDWICRFLPWAIVHGRAVEESLDG